MRGRHLGFAAASAGAALLILPGLGAGALAAPPAPAEAVVHQARQMPPPPDTGPYVLRCLNDGMAMWSDGTTGYSEWCATGTGGPHGPDGFGPMGAIDPALPPGPGAPGGPTMPGGPMLPGMP